VTVDWSIKAFFSPINQNPSGRPEGVMKEIRRRRRIVMKNFCLGLIIPYICEIGMNGV
jgi:hypothetical protein